MSSIKNQEVKKKKLLKKLYNFINELKLLLFHYRKINQKWVGKKGYLKAKYKEVNTFQGYNCNGPAG